MDGLHIVLLFLSGVVSYSHSQISGSALEATVQPGDNITLYCDCKLSTGVYIVWYRNCSHENQPPLIFQLKFGVYRDKTANDNFDMRVFPRFQFVRNYSSDSYDLMITNITESDEGLYYCGTKKSKVEDKEFITSMNDYRYGNITTRITVNSNKPVHCEPNHPYTQDCDLCWSLLFSLCPASAALSSLISSLVVYNLCRKTAKEPQVDVQNHGSRLRRLDQDEDVCYAALDIRQPSQRPKKKKAQSSDFSTYSAINTSRI